MSEADRLRADTSVISFFVPGIPQPRGSKTAMPNKAGGRPLMVDTNKKSKPWMHAVTSEAAAAMEGREPIQGPICLRVVFRFPRPKAHYRTGRMAHVVRDSAPLMHAKKPDCDKLLRAIGDAMTGVVYRDDAQIAEVLASKSYGEAGVSVIVTELPRAER